MKKQILEYFSAFLRPRRKMPPLNAQTAAVRGVSLGFMVISSAAFLGFAGVLLCATAYLLNSWIVGLAAGWFLRSSVVVLRPISSPFQPYFSRAVRELNETN